MKNVKWTLLLLVSVLCLSIGYSALNTDLSISGEAIVRADADIRVTDIKLESTENLGTELYNPEFTKNTTTVSVNFPNANSSITYDVTITNKTGQKIKVKDISEIINSNSNIAYSIEGIEKDGIYSGEEISFKITLSNKTNTIQEETLSLKYDLEVFDGYTITLVHDDEVLENNIDKEEATTNFNDITVNDNDVVVKCNNGAVPNYKDNILNVSNVSNNSTCEFYDSLNSSINETDITENNFLILKNIQEDKTYNIKSIMNFNLHGNTIYGVFNIQDDTKFFSDIDGAVISHEFVTGSVTTMSVYYESVVSLDNVTITSSGSPINLFAASTLNINNSKIYSTNQNASSGIWCHNGNTTLNVLNSYIEAPYGIGGQGGIIVVDNSEIYGFLRSGVTVNAGYCGDISILNGSYIHAAFNGINLVEENNGCSNSILIDGNIDNYPIIYGGNKSALLQENTITTINYGELYGITEPTIKGKLITRDNLELVTEDYIQDGVTYKHSYLK